MQRNEFAFALVLGTMFLAGCGGADADGNAATADSVPSMVTGTTGAPGPGTVGTPGTPSATMPDTTQGH